MKRHHFPVNLILAACVFALGVPAALAGEIKQEWQPTTLKEATLNKVNAGLEQYQRCLNDETRAHVNDRDDSRRVADRILQRCEDRLTPVKAAFDAEKVPGVISDRYIRSKRSKAAQQVVRVVMSAEASRYAEEHRD